MIHKNKEKKALDKPTNTEVSSVNIEEMDTESPSAPTTFFKGKNNQEIELALDQLPASALELYLKSRQAKTLTDHTQTQSDPDGFDTLTPTTKGDWTK